MLLSPRGPGRIYDALVAHQGGVFGFWVVAPMLPDVELRVRADNAREPGKARADGARVASGYRSPIPSERGPIINYSSTG